MSKRGSEVHAERRRRDNGAKPKVGRSAPEWLFAAGVRFSIPDGNRRQ